jgi:hypothetical protein
METALMKLRAKRRHICAKAVGLVFFFFFFLIVSFLALALLFFFLHCEQSAATFVPDL